MTGNHSFIHSFIHSGDLYSASSRDYYSEALPATDKKEGLKRDVKFGRVGHQQGTQNRFRTFAPAEYRVFGNYSSSANTEANTCVYLSGQGISCQIHSGLLKAL